MNKIYLMARIAYLFLFPLLCCTCKPTPVQENRIASVTRKDLTQEIVFSAKVMPVDITMVFSPVPGSVKALKIYPGEKVSAGDVVLTIEENHTIHAVTAPAKGVLLAVNYLPGEFILNNHAAPLFQIGTTNKKRITAEIDEIDASKIQGGDTFYVYNKDSFSLVGKVAYVNMLASNADGQVRFKLVGELNDSSGNIKQFGTTLPVKVTKLMVNNTLVVERGFIITRNNKSYLLVMKNGKAEEKEVVTGRENEHYVELLSGAREGDVVRN